MKKILFTLLTLCLTANLFAQVPTPNIANGAQYCVGTTKVYGDNPLDPLNTYTFNITGTSAQAYITISSGDQIQVTWATAGSYTITINETDPNGCTVTYAANITVNPVLTATIDPITVCEDGSTQPITGTNLGVNPVYSGTGVVSTVFDPTGLSANSYTITVTSTDANGCPITGTGTATVNPTPTGTINSN